MSAAGMALSALFSTNQDEPTTVFDSTCVSPSFWKNGVIGWVLSSTKKGPRRWARPMRLPGLPTRWWRTCRPQVQGTSQHHRVHAGGVPRGVEGVVVHTSWRIQNHALLVVGVNRTQTVRSSSMFT